MPRRAIEWRPRRTMELRHIRFEGTHTNRVSLGSRALARHPSLAGRRSPTRDEPVAGGLPAHILAQHGLDPARYRHRPAGAADRRVPARAQGQLRGCRMGTRRERSRSPGHRVEHLAHRRVFVLSRCRRLRGHPNDGRRCLDATRQTATRVERGLLNGRGVVQRRDDPRAGRAARRR